MMTADPTTTGATAGRRSTEQMWREVIAQLRGFVRRRIADPERAEDLVGEILLRIHQNLGSVDDRERLTHWVSRVARNAVIDEYRRAARTREHLVPAPEDVVAVEDERRQRRVGRAGRARALPAPAARRTPARAAARRADDRSRRSVRKPAPRGARGSRCRA